MPLLKGCVVIFCDLIQEQRELRQEVFGPMKPLPRAEYAHILQTTGIDIDGRKEMFQAEMPHIEQSIRRFITFVKSIPGFSRTPVEDQISIIKSQPSFVSISYSYI